MASLWQQLKAYLHPPPEAEQYIRPDSDSGTVTFKKPYKPARTVRRENLQGVDIEVTSRGPMLAGLHWILITPQEEISLPVEGDHAEELMHLLQTLPNFDQNVVSRTMQRTRSGRYPCWRPDAADE